MIIKLTTTLFCVDINILKYFTLSVQQKKIKETVITKTTLNR